MSDRVVVMRAGRIEQEGSPDEVFATPKSHFVAEFMGVTNLLRGAPTPGASGSRLARWCRSPARRRARRTLALGVRPERIVIAWRARAGRAICPAGWKLATYRGLVIDYQVRAASASRSPPRCPSPAAGGPRPLNAGQPVHVSWQPEAAVLVPL